MVFPETSKTPSRVAVADFAQLGTGGVLEVLDEGVDDGNLLTRKPGEVRRAQREEPAFREATDEVLPEHYGLGLDESFPHAQHRSGDGAVLLALVLDAGQWLAEVPEGGALGEEEKLVKLTAPKSRNPSHREAT